MARVSMRDERAEGVCERISRRSWWVNLCSGNFEWRPYSIAGFVVPFDGHDNGSGRYGCEDIS